MDIMTLAQQAISVVAQHLAAVATGVVDAAEQEAAHSLYALLRHRLDRTALGTAVLDQLQEQPEDTDRQQAVAVAVAEQAQADPEFAAMLRWSLDRLVQQGVTGDPVRHSPVNVTANRDVRLHRSYVAAGDIDNSRRSMRIGTSGWILAAVLLATGSTVTGIAVSGSDEKPDPMSIGTEIGDEGIRRTAETVRDSYTQRNADLLCALAWRLESGRIMGANTTGAALTPEECSRDLNERFDRLPVPYRQQSSTLAVERIGRSDNSADRRKFGLNEDEAAALLVNRDPEAICQRWELKLVRQNGRWVVDLNSFINRYVDPGIPGNYKCDA